MRRFGLCVAIAAVATIGVLPAAAQGKSGAARTAHAPKATAAKGPSARAAEARATTRTNNGKPSRTSSTSTRTTTPTTAPNPISTKISAKPEQLARITAMLPAGMTVEQASAGFRNQGQFIAALNASQNRGIDFAKLQTAMTVDGLSLGQAVKQLRAAEPAPAATTPTTPTTPTT